METEVKRILLYNFLLVLPQFGRTIEVFHKDENN